MRIESNDALDPISSIMKIPSPETNNAKSPRDGFQPIHRCYVGIGSKNGLYLLTRWSFYLFIFLIPLEYVDPFGIIQDYTITKISGFLLAAIALLQWKICLARPPKAFWCFLIYLSISFIHRLISTSFPAQLLEPGLLTLLQNILLFWICYNIMRYDGGAVENLQAMGAGGIVVSLLVFTGTSVPDPQIFDGRLGGLGMNPNVFSYVLSACVVLILGYMISRDKIIKIDLLLVLPLCLLIVFQIVQSGSRGGMLCLLTGIIMLSLGSGSFGKRLMTMMIIGIVLIVGFRYVFATQEVLDRWQLSVYAGSYAGREMIIPVSWEMFTEKPILGWGPVNHLLVLASRTASIWFLRDPHNDLLWALTAVGLFGTIPLVIGIGICVKSAWQGRKTRRLGIIPLALIMLVLMMSMSMTVHNRKITWFVLAYAAASSTYAIPRLSPDVENNNKGHIRKIIAV